MKINSREIFEVDGAGAELANRTLVQVGTGTPREAREAREAEAWVGERGGSYIHGAILGGPRTIDTGQSLLLFGGPGPAYRQREPTLRCLGGQVRYLGENIAAQAALDLGWLSQRFGLFLGVAHGARICEAEGVGVDLHTSMFPEGDRARLLAEVIHADAYDQPSATPAVWYYALKQIQAHVGEAGISAEVPDFIAGMFRRTIAAGLGEEDVAALVKVLRDAAGPGASSPKVICTLRPHTGNRGRGPRAWLGTGLAQPRRSPASASWCCRAVGMDMRQTTAPDRGETASLAHGSSILGHPSRPRADKVDGRPGLR